MEVAQLKPGLIIPGRQLADSGTEKAKLLERIGNISDVEVMGNRILVAKWIRDKEGSIIMSDKSKIEDQWQGKVGLVIAIGPQAYKEDETHDWGGQKVEVGQWVQFRYSDGDDFDLRPSHTHETVYCKWLKEGEIHAIISRPDFAH
jgi:hypothetical protein